MSDEIFVLLRKTAGWFAHLLSDYLRDAPQNVDRDAALAELRSTMKAVGDMSPEERTSMRQAFNEINGVSEPIRDH